MAEVLTPEQKESVYIATGRAHPALAQDVAAQMGVSLGGMDLHTHSNGELYARFEDNARGKHVIVVQTHSRGEGGWGVQDSIMEQAFMLSAARMAGAASITAAAPYLGYSRSDKKVEGREMIGAQTVIDILRCSGADTLITFDLHSGQTQGFHRGPFDDLPMGHLLREEAVAGLHARGYDPSLWMVVSPDEGALKANSRHPYEMGDVEVTFMPKSRGKTDTTQISRPRLTFDPDGRVCVMFDDMIDSGGTIRTAAETLMDEGAAAVHVVATHNIFSGDAIVNLQTPAIERIVTADTHPDLGAQETLGPKYKVVKCGPFLGRALVQNLTGGSVSGLIRA